MVLTLMLERALKLQNYFTQPFFVAERWTERPGTTVSLAEALQTCSDILDGRYDDLPVEAFYFSGDMAEIRGNVKRTLKLGPVTWPAHSEKISPIWARGRYDFETWERAIVSRQEALQRAAEVRWLLEDNTVFFRAYDAAVPGAGTALIERIRKRMAELSAKGAL
jgi:hypothetical protein